MSTIKKEIFSRIVELNTIQGQRIELAITDDIQKVIEATTKTLNDVIAANKAMNDSAAFSKKILKDAIDADTAYDKAAALNDKAIKSGNAQVDKAISMIRKVDSAADALGLDGASVKGYAQLEKLSMQLEDEVVYADKDAYKEHPGYVAKK